MPRQQTLQASIDWSHDLLTEPERVTFRRLSVFSGGWSLEAAEQVCSGPGVQAPQVLDLLTLLVGKSLVDVETDGERARYRMLETVRQYAADRLRDADEEDDTRTRHRDWCVGMRQVLRRAMLRSTARENLAAAEQPNLLDAFGWCEDNADVDGMALIGAALYWTLVAGQSRSVLGVFDRACQAIERMSPPARATFVVEWGRQPFASERLRPFIQEAVESCRAAADPQALTDALVSFVRVMQPAPDRRRALLEEAVTIARTSNDPLMLARPLRALAGDAADPQERSRLLDEVQAALAREEVEEGRYAVDLDELAVCVADGDARRGAAIAERLAEKVASPHLRSYVLRRGAVFLMWAGRLDGAEARYREALAIATTLDDPVGAAECHEGLAFLHQKRRHFEPALSELGKAIDCYESVGPFARQLSLARLRRSAIYLELGDDAPLERELAAAVAAGYLSEPGAGFSVFLFYRDVLLIHRGRLREAEDALHASLARLVESSDRWPIVWHFEALAAIAARQDSVIEAVRLLASAQAIRDETENAARTILWERLHAEALAATRDALDDEAFQKAWDEGAGLDWRQAVAYAQRGRGERKRPSSGWDSLTPTERQVVDLVAEGLTNVQVGERMFIAERTVGTHLTHVFSKLGMSSRTELAAAAARRRPAN
jgi:DNA-binding CsgD family transcriptional regulator